MKSREITSRADKIIQETASEEEIVQVKKPKTMVDWLVVVFAILSVLMVTYHILAFTVMHMKQGVLLATHLLFGLSLIYINDMIKSKKLKIANIIGIVVAAVFSLYVVWDYDAYIMRMQVVPNKLDVLIACVAIINILYATKISVGWALPIVASAFILYGFFGHLLPGPFRSRGYNLQRLATTLFSDQGIYGSALGVSASNVFLFLVFAAFLAASGADKIFSDLATSVAGKYRGGQSKISVVSSALFGMISGSAVANVVSDGAFTIPMMIKSGLDKAYAAAVEAVASTGGQIMPPVMGAAAFVLADAVGIPYNLVVVGAIIPAALYFISIYINVDVEAVRKGIKGLNRDEIPNLLNVLKNGLPLFIPLGILIAALMGLQWNAMRSAIVATAAIVLLSIFRKDNRLSFSFLVDSCIRATKSALQVVAACATSGIVVGIIAMTGLGLKLSNLIMALGESSLLLSLVAAMVVTIILGMGVPTTAAYMIGSATLAPALIGLGLAPFGAHMFIFYYAALSAITPPVAVASYAAAGLGDANPMKVGWNAVRIGIVAFVVPYAFVINTDLLLIITPFNLQTALNVFFAVLMCVPVAFSMQGWMVKALNPIERAIMFALGCSLLSPNNWLCLASAVVFFGWFFLYRKLYGVAGQAASN